MPAAQMSVDVPRGAVTDPTRRAAEAALLYMALCIPYILFSGQLAALAARTPRDLQVIETAKGLAFVAVTGALYFMVSYLRWRRIRRQEDTIIAQERTLLQTDRKLVAAMSAATVAHDLNNLLMSLSGLLDDLKAREGSDPFLLQVRQGIGAGIDKLGHLAGRLVSAAGRALPEKPEAVDVKATIEEMVSLVRKHRDALFCSFSTSGVTPLTLVLNRTLFEQALLNLLINAVQAAGVVGRVEVSLATWPGGASLAVGDSGPGVPGDLVEDIFEPCYSTKPDGTGIGLMSVRAFAASCGADLSVGRSPLGGAQFELRIPSGGRPS